jgi:hypothetical protein
LGAIGMIRIAAEPFERWHAEAAPLFLAHWHEIGTFKDAIKLDVDADKIIALEAARMWHAWTVREDGALIGYCCVLIAPHIHYRTHQFAYVDVIYLVPEKRRGTAALRLIQAMEAGLPQASKIIFHVKVDHDFGALLVRRGYVCTEKNYEKLMAG